MQGISFCRGTVKERGCKESEYKGMDGRRERTLGESGLESESKASHVG